jgi:hypothetical protein
MENYTMKRKFCTNRPGKRALFRKRNHRAKNTSGGIDLSKYVRDMTTEAIISRILQSTRQRFGF